VFFHVGRVSGQVSVLIEGDGSCRHRAQRCVSIGHRRLEPSFLLSPGVAASHMLLVLIKTKAFLSQAAASSLRIGRLGLVGVWL